MMLEVGGYILHVHISYSMPIYLSGCKLNLFRSRVTLVFVVIDHFLKNFDIIFGLYDCGFTCHVLEILSKKFECLWHKITCNMVHLHSLL